MRNRVVGPLISVPPVKRLRNHIIESHIHIFSYIRIIVLIDSQSSGGVLDEKEEHANLNISEAFLDLRSNLICDKMASLRPLR